MRKLAVVVALAAGMALGDDDGSQVLHPYKPAVKGLRKKILSGRYR